MLKQNLAVVLLIILSFSAAIFAKDPPLPEPVGRVIWIKGSLKAMMPSQEVRILQKSSVIYLKDTLETDASSQAQIAFTDNSLMTFKPNTKFLIDQYAYKPNQKSKSKYIMNLIEGGFRTITGMVAKEDPHNYQVNTPVATIGVRGTDYAVSLKGVELFVGFYSGKPCVSSGGAEVCLDKNKPYVRVPSKDVMPQVLMQQPEVFKEKLTIQPATIDAFTQAGNVGEVKTTRKTVVREVVREVQRPAKNSGGVVSSFCIQ